MERRYSNQPIALAWRKAWRNRSFRVKTVIASLAFTAILIGLPFFFACIEKRHGIALQDPVLDWLPAVDVSIPTFVIIWGMILLWLVRCVQDPAILIVSFCSTLLLFASRMATISLLPLDPPAKLIPLVDPVSNLFYGGTHVFMTKDLFYSGHTSTQFMIFLCLRKKTDKMLALTSSLLIGLFVLVQHVHYTIDVLGAFLFTYLIYLLGARLTRGERSMVYSL